MPKTTKNTRKTNTARVSKSPAKSTSKKISNKKKNGVVFGGLMPKRRRNWAVLIILVVLVGTIGSLLLYNSHANTYALTPAGCKIRGRVGEFNDVAGKYYCYSACRDYAGVWVANADGYGYCSRAITAASTMSQSKCSSLGRKWVGTVGCARVWIQAAYPGKNIFNNVLQCAKDGDDYHVSSSYDYCGSGAPTPSGGIIVGSISPVGGGWAGPTNCVPFVQWIVNIHSSRYDGRPMGAGGADIAGNMRSTYGYKNIRAPHAVASWPRGYAGVNSTYGHVALVDAVRSDGSIVVEESNWGDHWHSGRVVSASIANGLNYAYISDWN